MLALAAILSVTTWATRAMAAMPDAHVKVERRRSRVDLDTAAHSGQWRKWPRHNPNGSLLPPECVANP